MRLAGLLLLLTMPLLPRFSLAALACASRSFFNRGTNRPQQARSASLVGPELQGFAGSLNCVSLQFPLATGPLLAGLLFDAGFLALPFLLATGLQAAYLCYYGARCAPHERAVLTEIRVAERGAARV